MWLLYFSSSCRPEVLTNRMTEREKESRVIMNSFDKVTFYISL